MKRILLPILLLVLLSACIPSHDYTEADLPWVTRWLEDPACAAPCWEGIIPGETRLAQVDDAAVDPANRLGFYPSEVPLDGEAYSYWFNLDGVDKFHGVTVFAASADETIDRIQFEFGNTGSHLRVGDILSHFGEPESVAVDILAGGCRASLLFPDKKMWLTLERKKLRKTYEIKEDTLLSWSYFYTPSAWDEALQRYPQPDEQIQPWLGYEKYVCKKTW